MWIRDFTMASQIYGAQIQFSLNLQILSWEWDAQFLDLFFWCAKSSLRLCLRASFLGFSGSSLDPVLTPRTNCLYRPWIEFSYSFFFQKSLHAHVVPSFSTSSWFSLAVLTCAVIRISSFYLDNVRSLPHFLLPKGNQGKYPTTLSSLIQTEF